jgi:SAM-dependent methyltransferase
MGVRDILAVPALYQAFQEAGGFYGARLKAIRKYLPLRAGQRVIDIGCGPGFMARDIPPDIDYIGFDIDQKYIDYANHRFADKGRFFCRFFDEAAAAEFGPADVVMMNGVIHHIDDAGAAATLKAISDALKPGGRLFSLDGVYVQGQPWFSKFMLDHDRGEHIRHEDEYLALLRSAFPKVDGHIRGDLAWVPTMLFIAVSCKTGGDCEKAYSPKRREAGTI